MNNKGEKEFKIIEESFSREVDSPFFIKHKLYCENWEKFINHYKGKIEYDYTAWALTINASIPDKLKLKISSAQIANPGLFVKSYKSKFNKTIIEFKTQVSFLSKVHLKRRNIFDILLRRKVFLNKYTISGKESNLDLNHVTGILKRIEKFDVVKLIAKGSKIYIVIHDLVDVDILERMDTYLNR